MKYLLYWIKLYEQSSFFEIEGEILQNLKAQYRFYEYPTL
jgi:hypothetical protein